MQHTTKGSGLPPESKLVVKPLTIKKIQDRVFKTNTERMSEIDKEFADGFAFIQKYQKSVSFYGSARFSENNPHYIQARRLARRIVEDFNYAVITGGGHGIMEAANRGAYEAGGDSLGLNITLPHEQVLNDYLTDSIEFYYFFVRKVMLSFSAETYLFFPGGFGTLDEFFDLATLIQTKKIPPTPIVLIGHDYWEPLRTFIAKNMFEYHSAIDRDDMKIFTITEDEDEIMEIVKNAPMRKESKESKLPESKA